MPPKYSKETNLELIEQAQQEIKDKLEVLNSLEKEAEKTKTTAQKIELEEKIDKIKGQITLCRQFIKGSQNMAEQNKKALSEKPKTKIEPESSSKKETAEPIR